MSQPSSVGNIPGAEIPAQKQRADVYTVMLIVSFICIVTATILLYAELERWGSYPWWNINEAKTSAIWPVDGTGYQLASSNFVG